MNSTAKTQEDLVNERKGFTPTEITDKIHVPGLEQLHTKPIEEIAETLAMVLKSRAGITSITYTVGKSIDITYRNPSA